MDYYEILNLKENFTEEELKGALKNECELIQRLYTGNEAKRRMEIVFDAYNTLLDPLKRQILELENLLIEESKYARIKRVCEVFGITIGYFKNFTEVNIGDIAYYINGNGNVVAISTNNGSCLIFYLKCSRDVIWNHNEMISVTFINDFILSKNGEVLNADIISVNGLCGTSNSPKTIDNCIVDTGVDGMISLREPNNLQILVESLENAKKKLDNSGTYHDLDSQIQDIKKLICEGFDKQFKVEPIGEVIDGHSEVFFESDCFNFTISNTDIIKVKSSLNKKNFIVLSDFESRQAKMTANEINKKVYNYYRRKNDWNYNAGYNTTNSEETRTFVESRKNQNYDTIIIAQNINKKNFKRK